MNTESSGYQESFSRMAQETIVTKPDTSTSAHFNAFSPKLALSFRVNENQTVYASYNKGFRAGGISPLTTDPNQVPLASYKPEYSNHIEIGSKSSLLNNRVRLNIAAFYTILNDAQLPTLILPDATTIIRNTGKLNSRGIETDLQARLIRGMDLEYNFGFTDATYKNLSIGANGEEVHYEGNRQIFTPKVTSMAVLQFSNAIKPDSDFNLIVRSEWRYLGDHYFDFANRIKQSAYSIFNSKAGVYSNNFSLFAWVRNIADKTYLDYAYDFGAAHLGNPRTIGISISKSFK